MFFEVKNLCFSYYKCPLILKDVNFSFDENSSVLCLASKDSGKSTILKVLSGFEDSRFGNIFLQEKELKQISDEEKRFSLVLAEPVLLENKTVRENLHFQCEMCKLEKFDDEKLKKLFEDFEYQIDLNKMVKKLTLFEKRLVQIVRAEIKNPKILFLDDQFEMLANDELDKMMKIYSILFNKKDITIFCAIGDDVYKSIDENLKSFKFNKILYLNSANVKEFKTIDEFEKSYYSLDCLKFLKEIDLKECLIEKEEKSFAFCNNKEKLFIFDKKFNEKLNSLKLDVGEVEDCYFVTFKDFDLKQINDKEFNVMLENNEILIYSKLTGFRLF